MSAHAPPCLLPASGPAPGAFGPRRPCRPTAQPCAMRPGAAHPVPLCAASAPSEPSVALYGQGLSGLGGTACFQGARWGGRPQKVDCPWGLGWTVEVPFGLDGTAGTQGARWQSSRLSNSNKQKTPVNHRAGGGWGGGRAARVSVRGSSVWGTAGLVASCRSLLPGSRFRPVSLSRRTGGQGRGVHVPPASEAGALRLVQVETPHPSGGLLGSAFASGGAASQACGRRPACVRSGPLSATGSSRSTPE